MDTLLLKAFLPEFILAFFILLQLLFNNHLLYSKKYNFILSNKELFFQVLFILIAISALVINVQIEGTLSNGLFFTSKNLSLLKFFFLICSIILLTPIWRSFVLENLNFYEFFTFFLFSLLASLFLVNVLDLISIYLLVEMQTLCFYILATFKRSSTFSTEAGLKYFISSALNGGIFLLGCSIIYFCLGTLNLNYIELLVSTPFDNELEIIKFLLIFAVLLISITFFFKLTAAPFHFWSPDVYDGSPLSSTIIFTVLPKFIFFTLFMRWLLSVSFLLFEIKFIFLIVGFCSVVFGIFFALKQKRLKRFFIYSSIAQVGFIIAALSIQDLTTYVYIYFFLMNYIINGTLFWTLYSFFSTLQKSRFSFYSSLLNSLFISNLVSLNRLNPYWRLIFVFIFFSISGMPPFSGFLAKFYIFFSLIESKEFVYTLVLILLNLIAVFYYIRLLKVVSFEVISTNLRVSIVDPFTHKSLLDLDCFILALGSFLLLYIFWYPTFFLLFFQYILINFL
jgi:proton-translocating NADH-quinone oxidoreductase chain N